ncbi:MAG: nitrogenase component 1 [Cyanobacteriota bacterium]
MTLKMKIIESNNIFADQMQPGAFIGATLVASGIKNSAIIYHGYLGCNIESIHMRSDSIPGGFYTPIIATGLNESDSIYGGNEKLKATLEEVNKKPYDLIWILTGDATSITADDIYGIANTANINKNTTIIPLDVPGFLGGITRGTDIAISKLYDFSPSCARQTNSVCLFAPHLMGIKSHPEDIKEIKLLLERSGINVSHILSKYLTKQELITLSESKYVLPLTWENLPELNSICKKNNLELIDLNLPLPVGVSNSEHWLLNIAELFNTRKKAEQTLMEDKCIIEGQLKYNYNFSWLSTLYSEKTCSIYAHSQFAVSLAQCLFYDLNIKPKVISIIAETQEAINKSKLMLKELLEYTDFTLLINPDYYTYIKYIKDSNVDFAIGSNQDKPLCIGENIPHMTLSGYYFFNNFNFTPWPNFGIRGMLGIITELGYQMEKTFYYERYWKNYSYKPSEDNYFNDSCK